MTTTRWWASRRSCRRGAEKGPESGGERIRLVCLQAAPIRGWDICIVSPGDELDTWGTQAPNQTT